MPRELDGLYGETLKRIKGQPGEDGALGMRVLSWVTHARRPLSVEELGHGLAVEHDEDGESPDEFDPDNLLSSRSLVDVCAGLIVIDPRSQIIRLVHYTAQEYFDKEREHLFEDAESDISKACLTYLSYGIANTSPNNKLVSEALLSHPFLGYASVYWLSHIQRCTNPDQSEPVFAKAVKYVRDPLKILFSTMLLRKLLLQPRNLLRRELVSPLEAASECGIQNLTEFLLVHGLVSAAALNGALHCASSEGHADVVMLLIGNGADIGSLVADASNALQKACKCGHIEVAKVLLDNGANPNTSDRWVWTPLHYAARGCHSDLVALLLLMDADPNAQTLLGLTACHIAASRGDTVAVRFMLETKFGSGFNNSLMTQEGNTLLHSAAEAGHLEVIRLLLQRGFDVLTKNKHGSTAQDLLRDNQSMEAREVFSAYTEASLLGKEPFGEDLEFASVLASAVKGTRFNPNVIISDPEDDLHVDTSENLPSEINYRPFYDPDIDLSERLSEVDVNITNNEARSDGTSVTLPWAIPIINLVESSPPCSNAGSLEKKDESKPYIFR